MSQHLNNLGQDAGQSSLVSTRSTQNTTSPLLLAHNKTLINSYLQLLIIHNVPTPAPYTQQPVYSVLYIKSKWLGEKCWSHYRILEGHGFPISCSIDPRSQLPPAGLWPREEHLEVMLRSRPGPLLNPTPVPGDAEPSLYKLASCSSVRS